MKNPIPMSKKDDTIHDMLIACGYTHQKAPSCLAGFSGDHDILLDGEVIATRDAGSMWDWLIDRGDIVEKETVA